MPAAEVATVVLDASSVTTIINNLNSLYSTAMGQVITYTAILIGLVGILIPALSILFQWRSLKAEKKSLEKDIQEGIENAKLSIRNDLIVELKEQVSIEEKALTFRMEEKFKELDKKFERAQAAVFFLQANSRIKEGSYANATIDLCLATKGFLSSDDELNGQVTLKKLIEICLPKVDKKQYEELEIEKRINTLKDYLELKEVNVNNRYTNKISELKTENKKAMTR